MTAIFLREILGLSNMSASFSLHFYTNTPLRQINVFCKQIIIIIETTPKHDPFAK
jgi:hypothetical protein